MPMTLRLLAIVSSLVVTSADAAELTTATTPSLRARLSEDVVKQAVRETLAEGPREPRAAPSARV